ncbi:MAG: hypothetical protein ACK4VN_14060 [Bacteroidales bacterium]
MKTQATFLTILLLFVAVSCQKEDSKPKYDPEELIISIKMSESEFFDRAFLVLENSETMPVYIELMKGENYAVRRGDSIKGEDINLHFVYKSFGDLGNLRSYYAVHPGKTITVSPGMGNHPKTTHPTETASGNLVVDISFADVPDFTIATRNAMHSLHCHTSNTLEVPCANIGGNRMPVGAPFFVCLQNGTSAGYKFLLMPSETEYTLSLSQLNPNMIHHAIPKDPEHNISVRVIADGSAGSIAIYNLSHYDNDLFEGNFIDVFTPEQMDEMSSFSTIFRRYENRLHRYSAYFNYSQVVTNYHFPETSFAITRSMGQIPEITITGTDHDYIRIEMAGLNDHDSFYWDIVTPDPTNLRKFSFPPQVLEVLPAIYTDFFSHELGIRVSVHADSRLNSYDDVVNSYFSIQKPEDIGEYHITSATFSWTDTD